MIRRVLPALLLCLSPALATAGLFTAANVTLDRTHSVAGGSLTGARINSGQEFIKCSVSMQSITRGIRNAGSCSTTEPALLLAIQSIGPASEVRFGWDTANQCTFISVVQASSNLE